MTCVAKSMNARSFRLSQHPRGFENCWSRRMTPFCAPLSCASWRAIRTIELAQPARGCSVARSLSALVFNVLDKCAQFGQDLTFACVVEKYSWRCDGEALQYRLQLPGGNRRCGERAGHLCKSHTLHCRSEKGGIVVHNQWSRCHRLASSPRRLLLTEGR